MRRRKLLSLLVRVLVAATALVPDAAGARPRAEGPGLALEAVGFGSYFHYRPAPGEGVSGAVRLANRSRREMTVVLRPADVATAGTGGLQFGEHRPEADGRWLHLASRVVRLAAGTARTVGFRAEVPPTASPGDHLAGIVAVDLADVRAARRAPTRDGVELRFLPRLAVAVQLTVPGGRRRTLAAGAAGIEVTPSATNATLTLRSTGDRLVRGVSGELALRQGDTVLVRRRVDLGSFVPGTQITVRTPFEGVPARGRYRLEGTLRPRGAPALRVDEPIVFGAPAAKELRRERGQEARAAGLPVLPAAAVGAVLVLIIVALAGKVVRDRRLTARRSPPGARASWDRP